MIQIIDQKIRQMHAAVGALVQGDISSVQPRVVQNGATDCLVIDFNADSDEIALRNAVSLLLANIASLRDYLKVWCKDNSIEFKGDALINSNRSVALVHDLWNIDKHMKIDKPRSGHMPRLIDLRTVVSISAPSGTGPGSSFSINSVTGRVAPNTSEDGSA